jgi:hypothetical protein
MAQFLIGTSPCASPTNVSSGAESATSLAGSLLDVGDSSANKETPQEKGHSTAETSMKAWLLEEESKLKQDKNYAEHHSIQCLKWRCRISSK